MRSLLATGRSQDVDPYPDLVNVLHRISQHPPKRTVELAPLVWMHLFADCLLRLDLDSSRPRPFNER